jgi:hypothetical protein
MRGFNYAYCLWAYCMAIILIVLSGCGWESAPYSHQQIASDGHACKKVGGDGFWLPAYYIDSHGKICQ